MKIHTKTLAIPFLLALSLFSCQTEAKKNELERLTSLNSIPFSYTSQNNMAFEVLLNEQDSLILMFHTASSGLSLIESSTARIQSIQWESEERVESWGGKNSSRYSSNNRLSMGAFVWDSLSIWENQRSGPETDGKFGPDLFQGQHIEINNKEQKLLLHDSLPQYAVEYQKRPLIKENGLLFLEAEVWADSTSLPQRFLLHSGYGGALLLDDSFVQASGLSEQLEVISSQELRDSYGNIITTKKAILPAFNIGDDRLENLEIGFFEGQIAQQKISLIGAGLLRKFNIIIDAKRNFIYLKQIEVEGSC